MHGINRFGLSCPPSKSPLPKAHEQKATKNAHETKSHKTLLALYQMWAFGSGLMDFVGNRLWLNGCG